LAFTDESAVVQLYNSPQRRPSESRPVSGTTLHLAIVLAFAPVRPALEM
jgi:hypothetical protein